MPIPTSRRRVQTRKNSFLVSNQPEVAAVVEQGDAIVKIGDRVQHFVKQMQQVRDTRKFNEFTAKIDRKMVDLREEFRKDTDYETRSERFEQKAREFGEAELQNLDGPAAERGRAVFEASVTGNVARSNMEAASQEISAYDADVNEQLPGLIRKAADPTAPDNFIYQIRAEQLIQDGVDAGVYSASVGQKKAEQLRQGIEWERTILHGMIDPSGAIKKLQSGDSMPEASPLTVVKAMETIVNRSLQLQNREYEQDRQRYVINERQRKIAGQAAGKLLTDLDAEGKLSVEAVREFQDVLSASEYKAWVVEAQSVSATRDNMDSVNRVNLAMESGNADAALESWMAERNNLTEGTAGSLRSQIRSMRSAMPMIDRQTIDYIESQLSTSIMSELHGLSLAAKGNAKRDYLDFMEKEPDATPAEKRAESERIVGVYDAYKTQEAVIVLGLPDALKGSRGSLTSERVLDALTEYEEGIEGEATPDQAREIRKYRAILDSVRFTESKAAERAKAQAK